MRAPTDFLFPDPHARAGVAVHCVTVCGHLHEQMACAETLVKSCRWHEFSAAVHCIGSPEQPGCSSAASLTMSSTASPSRLSRGSCQRCGDFAGLLKGLM